MPTKNHGNEDLKVHHDTLRDRIRKEDIRKI